LLAFFVSKVLGLYLSIIELFHLKIISMNSFFIELFEYSHHFNQELSQVFLDNPEKVSEKALNLFCHTLNAHHIWNNRIEFKQTDYAVWQIHATKDFKLIDLHNFKQTLQILNSSDLTQIINYSNSKGETFSNSLRDILFHVVNHSTYHRGQIMTELKLQGIEPIVTDYIFYKR